MKKTAHAIELLSPARDAEVGRAAIDHGADAVYIGASEFSARSAAGNTVRDIAALVEYAHRYGVRIYVALNTILTDDETAAAERLVHELYDCGVDALIVQDMALLQMDIPPMELHASTQTDIRTPEKAKFLYDAGFTRLVLARELSLRQIKEIHDAVPCAEIEAFVHGALCVSYSGQCYMSECFKSRSANRGNCAQICRLPYTVRDARGRIIERDKHVLSLKDMNRSEYVERMMDAGVTSFKIEGRLKDISYVKNITAYYRQKIDAVLSVRKDGKRASVGASDVSFSPSHYKSFNRGTTSYFINGNRDEKVSFPLSPKSLGEKVGKVTGVKNGVITTDAKVPLHNGDGFCFVTPRGRFGGFRIDRSERNILYPSSMPQGICAGAQLYRNMDMAFQKQLTGTTAARSIILDFTLKEESGGFSLTGRTEDGYTHTEFISSEKQPARIPQLPTMVRVLNKTGDTPYAVRNTEVDMGEDYFIPTSLLASARRKCTDALTECRDADMRKNRKVKPHTCPPAAVIPEDYRANVSNDLARGFYLLCGAGEMADAYECGHPDGVTLAWCKHCLRYDLKKCPRMTGHPDEDYAILYLESGDVRMQAEFDCTACEMKLKKRD